MGRCTSPSMPAKDSPFSPRPWTSLPESCIGGAHCRELLVLRTLTGIAIGGAMPIIYSMLGDIFTARERSMVSALISLSLGVGVTLGQLLAGFVGSAYGWRLPFAIVALPAILTALLSLVIIEEPERGCTEEGLLRLYEDDSEKGGSGAYHYRERITAGKACGIFAVPTNCLVFLQGIPGCLPWSVIMVFLNDYLTQVSIRECHTLQSVDDVIKEWHALASADDLIL